MKLLYEEFTDIVTYVIRFVMKHSYLFEIINNNYWVLNFHLTQYYKIKKRNIYIYSYVFENHSSFGILNV